VSHDEALQRAMLAVTRAGGRAFRHEVGLVVDMRGHKHMIGVKGEPDLMGVAPDGRALAIEVKTGRATRTKEQFAFARMWMRHQGLYVLARYADGVDGDATIAAALTPQGCPQGCPPLDAPRDKVPCPAAGDKPATRR
jgi:hypothetical protein